MLLLTYPILYGTKYADNPINSQQEKLAISITNTLLNYPLNLSNAYIMQQTLNLWYNQM